VIGILVSILVLAGLDVHLSILYFLLGRYREIKY
jgi:hypothetical protein